MEERPSQIIPIHSRNGKTYWVESVNRMMGTRLKKGQYQSTNWDFAQTVLRQYRVCLDVGSNNACNAVHYAERFDRVECWEPTPLAQQLWHCTVRDCGVTNAVLHTEALAERAGTTEIILHRHNSGHNHLSHYDKNPRAKPERLGRDTHPITQRTLDSYHFEHVDFIKIDTEGYELYVIQGAIRTIKKCRPLIQMEILADQCRKFNYRAENLIEYMRDLNYRVCSKKTGWLDGVFTTNHVIRSPRGLWHNGAKRKRDMDLFFIPQEWNHKIHSDKINPQFNYLFEENLNKG